MKITIYGGYNSLNHLFALDDWVPNNILQYIIQFIFCKSLFKFTILSNKINTITFIDICAFFRGIETEVLCIFLMHKINL